MYYLLFYYTHDNYIENRKPHRQYHFDHIKKYMESGDLIMGGAIEDGTEVVIIFKSDTIDTIEDFVKNDPYVINGLIRQWLIKPWNMVTGELKPV